MDMITLSLAVRKALKELGVEVEKPKTVTFDGNISGKETFTGESIGLSGVYVKILDVAITAEELQKFAVTAQVEGQTVTNEILQNDITAIDQDGMGVAFTYPGLSGRPVIFSFSQDVPMDESTLTIGTYVLYDDSFFGDFPGYISALTYVKETIHQIDPKFIPGAVLPVVELSTVPTTDGATLTAEESALMDEVVTMESPIVAKFAIGGSEVTQKVGAVMFFTSYLVGGITVKVFLVGAGTAMYVLMNDGNTWEFREESA